MEEEFLQLCKDGDTTKVVTFLQEKRVDVNVTDKDGMSGIMHAAYAGHADMCQLLLDHNANVDLETNKDYFTALMFATLAGQPNCVEVLLRGNANADKRNKHGKTAANLGAFTGSTECLRIINNFLPLSEIEYHTIPRGIDQTDFLQPDLAPALHSLCCMDNLNPVKLLLYIKERPILYATENKQQVTRTFDRLVDKYFKKDVNEVIAFKIHYIACLFNEIYNKEKAKDIDSLIKHFLLGRKGDGFAINVEQFVRNAIKTFKYVTSQLVAQLIRALAPVTPGSGKPALFYVLMTLNGRHVDVDDFACRTCGEMNAEKRCSACKQVFYCNAVCQKMHWFTHKKVCEELKKRKPKCKSVEDDDAVMPPPPPPNQMQPPPNMQVSPPNTQPNLMSPNAFSNMGYNMGQQLHETFMTHSHMGQGALKPTVTSPDVMPPPYTTSPLTSPLVPSNNNKIKTEFPDSRDMTSTFVKEEVLDSNVIGHAAS